MQSKPRLQLEKKQWLYQKPLNFTKFIYSFNSFTKANEKTLKLLLLSLFLIVSFAGANASTFSNDQNLRGLLYGGPAFGDIDNDGYLDLILTGQIGYLTYGSMVYNNNGSGHFSNDDQNLHGVYNASAAFGDINNDGDLDLIVTGYSSSFLSMVYDNNGSGHFSNDDQNLHGVSNGGLALGDIDNDGDLDLILTGYDGSYLSMVYDNDGSGNFSNNQNLLGVHRGMPAFGDIDNDGDLDLIVTGHDASFTYFAMVYDNNGSGHFSNDDQNLYGVCWGGLAFGDIDNDGDLDLIITGNHSGSYSSMVYDNNGSGNFSNDQNLHGVQESGTALGDIDNDGDLDLIVTGNDGSSHLSMVYDNNGSGHFSNDDQNLRGVYRGGTAFGDIDNDGDLDLIVTGSNLSIVYDNDEADAGGQNNPNDAPSPPSSGFSSSYSGGKLTLSWGDGSDTETPANGLYYNLKVGTTSDANDTVSPFYGGQFGGSQYGGGYNGVFGNMMQRQGINLSISETTYYWAVQTIDTSLKAGEWSEEQTYTPNTVPDCNIWQIDGYDLNAAMPAFSYSADENLTVTFQVSDADNDDLNFNMWYDITANGKANKIIGDINLSTESGHGSCDTNSKSGMVCTWDWNISGIADNDYWITIEINDARDTNTATTQKSFAVDNTAPICSQFAVYSNAYGDYYKNSDTVHLEVKCNVTDLNVMFDLADIDDQNVVDFYAVDDGDNNYSLDHTVSASNALADGSKTVSFNACDAAGNCDTTPTNTITLDNTAPTVSISSPSSGSTQTQTTVTLQYTGSDATSGIAKYYVKADGGWIDNALSTSYTFSSQSAGSHTYCAKAEDNAGNTAETCTNTTLSFGGSWGIMGIGPQARPTETKQILTLEKEFVPLAEPDLPVLDQTEKQLDLRQKRFAAADDIRFGRRFKEQELFTWGKTMGYKIEITVFIENISDKTLTRVELVEEIPKEMAKNAAFVESDSNFLVIDDQLLKFLVGDIKSGEKAEITYWFERSKEHGPVTEEMFNRMEAPLALIKLGEGDLCMGVYCNDLDACTRDYCEKGECRFVPMQEEAKCATDKVCIEGKCVAVEEKEPETLLEKMAQFAVPITVVGIVVAVLIILLAAITITKRKKRGK